MFRFIQNFTPELTAPADALSVYDAAEVCLTLCLHVCVLDRLTISSQRQLFKHYILYIKHYYITSGF